MTPELLAILITSAIEVAGLVILGVTLGVMLRQITAMLTFNVLQGRRIEEVLREMAQPPAA